MTSELPLDHRSISWRVSAEPSAMLGGGRALLLQVAHPAVAAGVRDHSSYESDPWARLFRTFDMMLKLSFGSPEASRRQAELFERMHRRVTGTTEAGEAYRALDPTLLLWVWATLCDSALLTYERVLRVLDDDERERYYDEWKLVARACGVPAGDCPDRWADFQAYVAAVIEHDLVVTATGRRVAHVAMLPPIPPPLRRPAAWMNELVTTGLLPASVREQYGLAWDPRRQRRLDLLLRVAGSGLRVTPGPVRRAGSEYLVRRDGPLDLKRLRGYGARATGRRMATYQPT